MRNPIKSRIEPLAPLELLDVRRSPGYAPGTKEFPSPSHTEGKWKVRGDLDNIIVESEMRGSPSRLIAHVKCYDHHIPNYEESRANANLIAAAPELLRCLISLVKITRPKASETYTAKLKRLEGKSIKLNRAKAIMAIQKAMGE